MKKNYMVFSGMIILIVLLIGVYIWKGAGPAEDSVSMEDSEVIVYEPSVNSMGLTDEEIRAIKGTPEDGGMEWSYKDPDIFQNTFGSMEGLEQLTVFRVSDNIDNKFMKQLSEGLSLKEKDSSLNQTADGFYYDESAGNAEVSEDTMEMLINDLHIGVWQDSVNYGKISQYNDHAYEMTFEFHGYPWESDKYGNSESGENILYGITSRHSLAWEFNNDGSLTKFAGFSYELTERALSNKFQSTEELEAFVTGIMDRYALFVNQSEKKGKGYFPAYEVFDITSLELCYSQEVPDVDEQVSMFVPVLVLNGEKYRYNTGDDLWTAEYSAYAISLESGKIYNWRVD